jgi:hypothetical protein
MTLHWEPQAPLSSHHHHHLSSAGNKCNETNDNKVQRIKRERESIEPNQKEGRKETHHSVAQNSVINKRRRWLGI